MVDLERDARLDARDFYVGDPFPVFETLRRTAPVWWYEPGKFWAVTKFDDVKYISRRPELFSSASGFILGDLNVEAASTPERFEEMLRDGMSPADMRASVAAARSPGAEGLLYTDPPRHNLLRRLVSTAFTPRVVAGLQPLIEELTAEALDKIEPGSTADFVEALAVPVPMHVIADLLGVPRERWADFRRWSDASIASVDEVDPAKFAEAQTTRMEMVEFFITALDERARQPRDDMLTRLTTAEIDGEKLSFANQMMFCITLLLAGNETTRTLISGAARALAEHPEQRSLLVADPEMIKPAMEECLRWVTPIMHFCRTATDDTEIRGQRIAKGDYVVMLYQSANRDEDVWERPDVFDVTRPPDPSHLAFGWGQHLCMGASLARLETRIVFEQLLGRFPNYELEGPPQRLSSTLINGTVEMPVRFE